MLKSLRRDKLASTKSLLSTDKSVKAVLSARRSELKRRFETVCKERGGTRKLFGQLVMPLSVWLDDASER